MDDSIAAGTSQSSGSLFHNSSESALTDGPVLLPTFSLISLWLLIPEHQEFIFCPGSEISIAAAVPMNLFMGLSPLSQGMALLHS